MCIRDRENASLVKSPDDIRLFLELIGISPSGNFAHVDFDAKTGEVLLAEEKLEKSNGEVEWKADVYNRQKFNTFL